MIEQKTFSYFIQNQEFIGEIFYPKIASGPSPAVLVVPTWKGIDDFTRDRAQRLAELGYVGFAVDLYGSGKEAKDDAESTALMMPLFLDRPLLQTRINGALEAILGEGTVDRSRIAAVGFCFGGLTVIELARSGANVKGIVSFHGVLANGKGEQTAKTVPISSNVRAAMLILQGYDDPLVSQEDVLNFEKEMTDAQVDWQFVMFGGASHAFTNPNAQDPEKGLVFNRKVSERSWIMMKNFLKERFRISGRS